MARDFPANADWLNLGSDASIDNYTQRSVLAWCRTGTAANEVETLVNKGPAGSLGADGWFFAHERGGAGINDGAFVLSQGFSTTGGEWQTPNSSFLNDTDRQVAVTYDRGAAANNPIITFNGTVQGLTELPSPIGNSEPDAADGLEFGTPNANNNRWAGAMGMLVYDSTIFTAADKNRHRWWGVAPGGPSTVDVWHPLWTTALANKGTAVADITLNGAPGMVDIPKVERMHGAMMGVGR